MSERAESNVEALATQASVLRRFASSATSALGEADRAAAEVVDRVRGELARRRSFLEHTEAALRACLQAERGSCEGEARAVEGARRAVASAEQALRIAERGRERFQAPKARYARECERLAGEGSGLLAAMSADLEAYLQRSGGAGGGGAPAAAGSHRPAPGGGTAVPAGAPEGWALVPLSAIDDSDSTVTGPESFKKGYSPADLEWAFGALHEVVLPAMARGKGLDYFQQRDAAEGRMGSRSYSDTFLGFFGGDSAVKLDEHGDGTFGVTNGYHRIWVAKRMGLSSIPGRLR